MRHTRIIHFLWTGYKGVTVNGVNSKLYRGELLKYKAKILDKNRQPLYTCKY